MSENEIARKMLEALFSGAISSSSAEAFQTKLWELLSEEDRRNVARMYVEYIGRSLSLGGKHSPYSAEEMLLKQVRSLVDSELRATVKDAVKSARENGEFDAVLKKTVSDALADFPAIREAARKAVASSYYDSDFNLESKLADLVRNLVHSALMRSAKEIGCDL